MNYKIEVSSPQEAELLQQFDFDGFMQWDRRLAERTQWIGGRAQLFREQTPFGYRAGVNTGEGLVEGTMSAELFLALGSDKGPYKDDPDWWKDDKKFYAWLKENPLHDCRPGKTGGQGARQLDREQLAWEVR